MKRIPAAILLAMVCLWAPRAWAQEPRPTAVLSLYVGQAFVWHQGQASEAELGQALQAGDSIRTGKGSMAELGFADGTSIRLGENTSLYVQAADSTNRSFKLFWGKLWTKVAKLSLKSQFTVETPTAVAGVRGTVFRVEIDRDSTTRVAVEEGLVEVTDPWRRGKMLRLAALKQSYMTRNRDPVESGFDPQKENRWERWSQKMFQELRLSARSLMSGLNQAVKSQEKLWESARNLEKKKLDAGRLLSQSQNIERQAFQNRRKFKLLQLRLERRLHQATVLAARVESDSGQAGLGPQAAELQSELEALTQKFQSAESGILEIIERLQSGLDKGSTVPPGDTDKILARLNSIKAKAATGLADLRKVNAACEIIEPKLAELQQKMAQVKEMSANQPFLAKQQFLALRQEYLTLRANSGRFDFPELEKLLPESRSAAMETKQLARFITADNPKNAMSKEIENEMAQYSRQAVAARQRAFRIERQARALDRLILELETLFKL